MNLSDNNTLLLKLFCISQRIFCWQKFFFERYIVSCLTHRVVLAGGTSKLKNHLQQALRITKPVRFVARTLQCTSVRQEERSHTGNVSLFCNWASRQTTTTEKFHATLQVENEAWLVRISLLLREIWIFPLRLLMWMSFYSTCHKESYVYRSNEELAWLTVLEVCRNIEANLLLFFLILFKQIPNPAVLVSYSYFFAVEVDTAPASNCNGGMVKLHKCTTVFCGLTEPLPGHTKSSKNKLALAPCRSRKADEVV